MQTNRATQPKPSIPTTFNRILNSLSNLTTLIYPKNTTPTTNPSTPSHLSNTLVSEPPTSPMSPFITGSSPWLKSYVITFLSPSSTKSKPPTLDGTYLQVITTPTQRRQLTVYDGQHTMEAILSPDAASFVDADHEDTGITTRNLLGHVIAPVSIDIITDMTVSPPSATLVLKEVAVFADRKHQLPVGNLENVVKDSSVAAAIQTNVGCKIGSFSTVTVLQRTDRELVLDPDLNPSKDLAVKELEALQEDPSNPPTDHLKPAGAKKPAVQVEKNNKQSDDNIKEDKENDENMDGIVMEDVVVEDPVEQIETKSVDNTEENDNKKDKNEKEQIEKGEKRTNEDIDEEPTQLKRARTGENGNINEDEDTGMDMQQFDLDNPLLGTELPQTQHFGLDEDDILGEENKEDESKTRLTDTGRKGLDGSGSKDEALKRLDEELEGLRRFRRARDLNPVGFCLTPDAFFKSVAEQGTTAKTNMQFPPPDMRTVFDVSDSAPL